MFKRKKRKHYVLKKPSLLRRVWKVWLYNIILTAFFFWWFWGNYTIDDLCFELDYFLMNDGIFGLRKELVIIGASFWFMLRQFFKDLNLIKYTYLARVNDREVIEKGGSKQCYEGIEGQGKTLSMANDVLLIASDQQDKLDLKYYLMCPYSEQLKDDADFKAIKDAYDFYDAHPDRIPHLMTNFKFEYDKRKAYEFDIAYFNMEKRIAEGFALGLTEIANILPNAWSKVPADEEKDVNKLRIKNEFFSLSRQYAMLRMIVDEHRTGEIYLGFRAVISSNKRLEERYKVLTPHFLEYVLKKVRKRIKKKAERTSKRLSRLHNVLYCLIEDIGFYVFFYDDKEAIKDNVKTVRLRKVISCDIPFTFDTRGERVKYRLYGKKPDEVVTS